MNTIHFACGATREINGEPPLKKTGTLQRVLVYGPGITGPLKDRNCLFGCPAKTKDSGRKEIRAWVGKTEAELNHCQGEPSLCVTCQPTHVTYGV